MRYIPAQSPVCSSSNWLSRWSILFLLGPAAVLADPADLNEFEDLRHESLFAGWNVLKIEAHNVVLPVLDPAMTPDVTATPFSRLVQPDVGHLVETATGINISYDRARSETLKSLLRQFFAHIREDAPYLRKPGVEKVILRILSETRGQCYDVIRVLEWLVSSAIDYEAEKRRREIELDAQAVSHNANTAFRQDMLLNEYNEIVGLEVFYTHASIFVRMLESYLHLLLGVVMFEPHCFNEQARVAICRLLVGGAEPDLHGKDESEEEQAQHQRGGGPRPESGENEFPPDLTSDDRLVSFASIRLEWRKFEFSVAWRNLFDASQEAYKISKHIGTVYRLLEHVFILFRHLQVDVFNRLLENSEEALRNQRGVNTNAETLGHNFYLTNREGGFGDLLHLYRTGFGDWHVDKGLIRALVKRFANQYDSIVDLGAGGGKYSEYLEAGFSRVVAVDGSPIAGMATFGKVQVLDLTKDVRRKSEETSTTLQEQFDLGFCIEVAEHLPPEAETQFLRNLDYLVKFALVLSWSNDRDNQYHLNPKSSGEVRELLGRYNFVEKEEYTEEFRAASQVPWVKKNVMVFVRADLFQNGRSARRADELYDVFTNFTHVLRGGRGGRGRKVVRGSSGVLVSTVARRETH